MNTLELVPLRSKYPYSGHITVRHVAPVINPVAPLDLIVEDLQDIEFLDDLETVTTPQVPDADRTGETTAGKGRTAR
jgi:hypothetical protein